MQIKIRSIVVIAVGMVYFFITTKPVHPASTLRVPIGDFGRLKRQTELPQVNKNVVTLVKKIQNVIKKNKISYPIWLFGSSATFGERSDRDIDIALPIYFYPEESIKSTTLGKILNSSLSTSKPPNILPLVKFISPFNDSLFLDFFLREDNNFVLRITQNSYQIFSPNTVGDLYKYVLDDCLNFMSESHRRYIKETVINIDNNIEEYLRLLIYNIKIDIWRPSSAWLSEQNISPEILCRKLKMILNLEFYNAAFILRDIKILYLLHYKFEEYFANHPEVDFLDGDVELTRDILVHVIRDLFDTTFESDIGTKVKSVKHHPTEL